MAAAPICRAGCACAWKSWTDDKPALLDFGIGVVTRLCETLLARRRAGAALLHHQSGRARAAPVEESGTGAASRRGNELVNSGWELASSGRNLHCFVCINSVGRLGFRPRFIAVNHLQSTV